MPTLRQFSHDGDLIGPTRSGAAAQAGLQRLGIESGRWTLQPQPVSSTPQLTYARELNALQRRFGTVLADRLRWPTHRPRAQAEWPEPETTTIHVHDDLEIRVVLDGHARHVVAAGEAGGWVAIDCEPGTWIALPAGLPHALAPAAGQPVDMMRLFTRPRGWVARPTDAGEPPLLQVRALAEAA